MAKRYAFIVANSETDMVFQLNKLDKSDAEIVHIRDKEDGSYVIFYYIDSTPQIGKKIL